VAHLTERPHPDWPLTRVSRVLYRDTLDRDALGRLAAIPSLPESWRRLALRRLESGRVEDWSPRVETPS
jgi:MOSC domain-containing protein YiiM